MMSDRINKSLDALLSTFQKNADRSTDDLFSLIELERALKSTADLSAIFNDRLGAFSAKEEYHDIETDYLRKAFYQREAAFSRTLQERYRNSRRAELLKIRTRSSHYQKLLDDHIVPQPKIASALPATIGPFFYFASKVNLLHRLHDSPV